MKSDQREDSSDKSPQEAQDDVGLEKNIIKEALKQVSVYRDETKLSIDYTPLVLPHREEIIRTLAQLFKSLIESPGGASRKVIITGATGTGKTAVTKRFGALIQEVAGENDINLRYVHVNCRRNKTPFLALTRIIQHFNPKFPKRGLNVAELIHILSHEILAKEDAYILLCFDEADHFILSDPSIIYDLTRLQDDSLNPKQRLSLITVAKNDSFKKGLDPSISSTFQCSTIHLDKYSKFQLEDILKERIKEAFSDGTVLNDTISYVSDLAAISGDARYALELLWLAGKYADEEGALQVSPDHTRKAITNLDPGIQREVIRDLGLHQKLFLLAVARQLKNTQKAYVILSDCQKAYRTICEEHGIEHHSYTKVWEYVKELVDISGCLSSNVSCLQGRVGRTTLLRVDVPVDILTQILENQIEDKFKLI